MWYTFATFLFLNGIYNVWISNGCQKLSETFEQNWSLSHFSKAYITWLRNLRNWLDHLFDQLIWKTATKNKIAHEVRKDSWAISDTRCERFSKVSCENEYSFNNNMIWFFSGWTSEDLTQEMVNIMGNIMGYNLVGGFKHGFYFPFHIWDVILPIDFHIFQRGRYTTNQIFHS